MKKLIFVLLLNAYLFSCTGQGCISHNGNCYGFRCISHNGNCYGDGCIANGGSGHGRNCISNGSLNCNSLPQSIIDQYPDVVFTIEQRSTQLQKQLASLQQQLAKTPEENFGERIRLHLQILQLQEQTDPASFASNFTSARNTIQTLIDQAQQKLSTLRNFNEIITLNEQIRGWQLELSEQQRRQREQEREQQRRQREQQERQRREQERREQERREQERREQERRERLR